MRWRDGESQQVEGSGQAGEGKRENEVLSGLLWFESDLATAVDIVTVHPRDRLPQVVRLRPRPEPAPELACQQRARRAGLGHISSSGGRGGGKRLRPRPEPAACGGSTQGVIACHVSQAPGRQ